MKCVHLDECTCSIYGLPAVIMRPITQLQLPRQLIPYGASATLAAKPGALKVATVLLLEADHKAESIDEQVTINRGSCMQREAKKKKVGMWGVCGLIAWVCVCVCVPNGWQVAS